MKSVTKGMKAGELSVVATGTPKFKFYRRGTGELDTSNFHEIAKAGRVEVHHLDSRALVALDCLSDYLYGEYLQNRLGYPMDKFVVVVTGYVCHMRADKDTYDPTQIYISFGISFDVRKVQHDSRNGIKSAVIHEDMLMSFTFLRGQEPEYTRFVGADSSVHKFFPEVDVEAKKIRKDGKVVSLDLSLGDTSGTEAIVIVDDILGGGATIQMCVDRIKESGYKGDIFLWTEWNEGIHTEDFLKQFAGVYIGENIYEVN